MAFLTYKKMVVGDQADYEQLASLKLGGRDGLIARHVRTLKDEDSRSWKLDVAGLLALAGLDSTNHTAVLFDVAGRDADSVCLYELICVHGSCRDTSTQLALDFAVVLDQDRPEDQPDFARKFTVTRPEKPRLLGETLALSGGPGGGDWKWGVPPMQLGATIVQAQSGHGHGSGEPCPNCNCGRRAALT